MIPVPTAAQAHQHIVIVPDMRDTIDQKMTDAVAWASDGSREDGLPCLTSDSVKLVFLAPTWNNRGGPDVKNPGLRSLLLRHCTEPADVAWSWLYHSHGVSVTGTFQRYSRGGNRSAPIDDWQGRARRLVQWDRPFDQCECSNCNGGELYSSPRAERLLELKSNMLTLLLAWSTTLMHGVWLAADGVVRLGYGSRAALWTNFGSEFRIFNGARTFQALLAWLAEEGHIIGDLASKKLKKLKTFALLNLPVRVQRPLKRPRRSVLIDVFSGFQSLAYLAASLSLTYISVDISAVLVAGTSSFSATLVQDLSLLPHGRIIQCILEVLGISAACVALIWCSPPCRTFSGSDAVNATITDKRPEPCNYREHGPMHPTRPPRFSRFDGDPYRALAIKHDLLVSSLFTSLLSCGLRWIAENPAASLARRTYMKCAGEPTLAHYCAFLGSFYHKPAHFWNSNLKKMALLGFAGSSKCGGTPTTCACGHTNPQTARWNHDNTIAGRKPVVPHAPSTSVLKMKNSIPEGLQLAVARHFDLIE
jgi:hypothetical protein